MQQHDFGIPDTSPIVYMYTKFQPSKTNCSQESVTKNFNV